MDVSKSYISKKHEDKVAKKSSNKPLLKQKYFTVSVDRDEILIKQLGSVFSVPTGGVPVGSRIYTPYIPVQSWSNVYMIYDSKVRTIHNEIKRVHSAICKCKRFVIATVNNPEIDDMRSIVVGRYYVSCCNLDLLEFQLSFEDSVHEYF